MRRAFKIFSISAGSKWLGLEGLPTKSIKYYLEKESRSQTYLPVLYIFLVLDHL